jgi:transcriptional regulator with XRE-family HTH domain
MSDRRAEKLKDPRYRHAYVSARVRQQLAFRIRQLRGDRTQAEFGRLIKKTQSVVSRLEDPSHGRITIKTLLEIAKALDMAVIANIVDMDTFLKFSDEQLEKMSELASE